MTDQPRCEPPEGWRDRKAKHWLVTEGPDGLEQSWIWIGNAWLGPCDIKPVTPEQAHERGYRYLAPVTPPHIVRGLVEALEGLIEAGVIPKSSAKEGGAMRFSSQVAAADLARAALKAAKEAGV